MYRDGGRFTVGVSASVGVEVDGGAAPGESEGAQEVGREGRVAKPAKSALRGMSGRVGNGSRGDRDGAADRGLEKRGVEAKNLTAIAAGSFRKEQNGKPGREQAGNLPGHRVRTAAAAAIDEDGSCAAGEETEGRPPTDFLLGHKDAGHRGGVDQNIQIAQVIRADEPSGGGSSAAFDRDPEPADERAAGSMQPLRPRGCIWFPVQTQQGVPDRNLRQRRKQDQQAQSGAQDFAETGSSGRKRLRAAGESR